MNVLSKVPELESILKEQTKALIFDMDGTLLNTEVVHAEGLHQIVKSLHTDSKYSVTQLLEEFCGVAEPEVFRILKEKNIIENISFDDFILEKNKNFEFILADENILAKLFHSELGEFIKAAKNKGIKIALVTASERGTTELFLTKLNLKDLFDIIITRNDTEQTKPHPMPYIHCFNQLGIEAGESIIFEDSETGLASAKASKANFYKVTWY